MNFKLTKKKTITSIILGIVSFIIVIISIGSTCIGDCPSFFTQIKGFAMLPFTSIFWYVFLQVFGEIFVLIYIIWSLFENKK